jgi:membrane protein DedA with SNARE-associated domain
VIETFYSLVPQYGGWVLFVVTFLSCLAVPFPASLVMLAAGAFVASGDLSGVAVVAGALGGAVLGDQVGYLAGRVGGRWLMTRLARRPAAAAWLARAEARMDARAGRTVFLSRWLASALGPYVNIAAGASGVAWQRFTVAAVLGEAVWVALYVGLGILFSSRIEAIGATLPSVLAAVAAAAVALMLGRALWQRRSA